MRRNVICVVLLLLTVSFKGFSRTSGEFLGKELYEKISSQGKITSVQTKKMERFFNTQDEKLTPLIQSMFEGKFQPTVMVESLYFYKKTNPNNQRPLNETEKNRLFNRLTALSSLTGIQYYSASRKTMRTLYEVSYCIDHPESRKKIPDPVFQGIPNSVTVYAFQKDLTFGENVYTYRFQYDGENFSFIQRNETVMKYGFVPIIDKGNLRSLVVLYDCDDALLVYILSYAQVALLPGMETKIKDSFGNRADALYNWLVDSIKKEMLF
ncbi:MAG: hypothetical protein N2Z76_07720 [Treponemataceae bacterium]|nr:hypothetical protein [Treponemataceae bacterium]